MQPRASWSRVPTDRLCLSARRPHRWGWAASGSKALDHTADQLYALRMALPAEGSDVEWTQLLLNLVDEGRRVATYKLAVLLGLIDACVLDSDAGGNAPTSISTEVLAQRVIELYWPQVRAHPDAPPEAPVLRQTSGRRAVTVDAIRDLREAAEEVKAHSVAAARQAVPSVYERTLAAVQLNLVRMPLGKLQRPLAYREGSDLDYPRFLYDDSPFNERATPSQLPLVIELQAGVGTRLVRLAGLLRPLIQLHWTREVARRNRSVLTEDGLHRFLFGTERVALRPVRKTLIDMQDGTCFYCCSELEERVEIDHFVPWSRLPVDGLANLVAAHARCNNSKRDHFADLELLGRWARRDLHQLDAEGCEVGWPAEVAASRSAARTLYAHLPTSTALWTAPGVFTMLDTALLRDVLLTLEPS